MTDAARTPHRPRPPDFDDVQGYLRAMVAYLRATEPRFSYRWFSRVAGFSSPNFLKLVADGQRRMSAASIEPFIRGLGLNVVEGYDFEVLVRLDLATTDDERVPWLAELEAARHRQGLAYLDDEAPTMLSDWSAPIIRESIALDGFRDDPAWLARHLIPAITPGHARALLDALIEAGLAERLSEGGLRRRLPRVRIGPSTAVAELQRFQATMAERAAQAIDRWGHDARFGGGFVVPLSEAQLDQLRHRIEMWRTTLFGALGEGAGPDAQVYCVGLWCSPFTRPISLETADDAPSDRSGKATVWSSDDPDSARTRPDPLDFDDYPSYLTAMIAHLRAVEPRFSYRWFAARAGFASASFLKLVADGGRGISAESIEPFARGLGLDAEEARRFEALAQLGIAKTAHERARWAAVLREAREQPELSRPEGNAARVLGTWWGLVIRAMTTLPGFREDPAWIARQLCRPLSPERTANTVRRLLALKLLERGDDGRLRPTDRKFTLRQPVSAGVLDRLERSMLVHHRMAIGRIAPARTYRFGAMLPLDPPRFAHLRAELRAFVRALYQEMEAPRADPAAIYHVAASCFPVTAFPDPPAPG